MLFCPRIENEYLLCFLWRLLPGTSIGTQTDDIELYRTSVREIGEVASVRFAQETRWFRLCCADNKACLRLIFAQGLDIIKS